jgi:hypothetical protein
MSVSLEKAPAAAHESGKPPVMLLFVKYLHQDVTGSAGMPGGRCLSARSQHQQDRLVISLGP